MITAVDTSIFLDVFLLEPRFEQSSTEALQQADAVGSLMICEIVYAELASNFNQARMLDQALARLEVRVESLGREVCFEASRAFRAYRRGGGPRGRVLPDFLIGAHAQLRAGQLLTRDRGFYRGHFRKLRILDPTNGLKK